MRKATVVLLAFILSVVAVSAQEPPAQQVAGGTGVIAFASCEGDDRVGCDIYLIDASAQIVEEPTPRQIEASVPVRLTDDDLIETHLAWSPDGYRIAYRAQMAGDNENDLYIMDVDSGEVTLVVETEADLTMPAWSLEGSHLAYVTITGEGFGIDAVNVETGEVVTVLEPQAEAFYPYWSAKESCDLYPDNVLDESSGLPYVLNLEDGEVIGIGTNTGEGAMACAMEDRWLSYVEDGALYVMNELTGEEIPIAGNDLGTIDYPAWSPNGEWLLFVADSGETTDLYIAHPSTEMVKRLTTDRRILAHSAAWQPYVLQEGASLAPEKGSVWTVEISPDKMVGDGCTQVFALCSFRAAVKPLEDGALEWTGQEMQPYRLEQVGPNTYEYSGRSVLDNGEAMLRVTFTGPETFEFEQELSFDAETDCLHTYTGTATFNWFSRE